MVAVGIWIGSVARVPSGVSVRSTYVTESSLSDSECKNGLGLISPLTLTLYIRPLHPCGVWWIWVDMHAFGLFCFIMSQNATLSYLNRL